MSLRQTSISYHVLTGDSLKENYEVNINMLLGKATMFRILLGLGHLSSGPLASTEYRKSGVAEDVKSQNSPGVRRV